MGSMTSRPKVPKTSVQTVYVPAPTYTYTPPAGTPVITPPTGNSGGGDGGGDNNTGGGTRSEVNLLERRRGTLSTVLTGFRGILSDTLSGTRKTLLGE